MGKFRPSNRVIFIGGCNSPHPTLTLYKTYTVINTYVSGLFIDVVGDNKEQLTYESKAFALPLELRAMKISKLKEKCSTSVIR
jgi:hypothetical protein